MQTSRRKLVFETTECYSCPWISVAGVYCMTLSFENMIKMLVSSPLWDIELQKHFSSPFLMTMTF
jgi:hypothetical protein